ncbi:MAG: PhzF family phenazine biosynthesis isomerase, partial [Dokdonella sp.]
MNTLTVRRFMQIDVFTDQPGYGNALAVVLDAQDLTASSMQRLAAWTNLSETSFLLPPDDTTADYKVRIFTPRQELPFAGHPSVGTAFAAMHAGIVTPHDGKLTQQCAAGLLPLRIEAGWRGPRVHVRAPRASQRDATAAEREALLAMFPDQPADRIAASCLVNNGPSWWLVPLE